ncbi:MAG: 50S ribosomal protein L6 [Spirochaetales bacterium]
MSRIGNAPIVLPHGVEFSQKDGNIVVIKGPLGQLEKQIDGEVITLTHKDNTLHLSRVNEDKAVKSKHGLYRALIFNMVEGVTKGYKKSLMINGVGYKAAVAGSKLTLNVGFSHSVEMEAPHGIKIEIPKANIIEISGIDKELVGQFAAQIRKIKPVEPYHGYGVRYLDEVVIHKEGKKAGK